MIIEWYDLIDLEFFVCYFVIFVILRVFSGENGISGV